MVIIYKPPLKATSFFPSTQFSLPLKDNPCNAVMSLDHPVPTCNPYGKIGAIYYYFFSTASLTAVRVRITSEDYYAECLLCNFSLFPLFPLCHAALLTLRSPNWEFCH